MNTGRLLKLVAYCNFLADCLKKPVRFLAKSDHLTYKSDCINVITNGMQMHSSNEIALENTRAFPCGNMPSDIVPSDIVTALRELSDDPNASAILIIDAPQKNTDMRAFDYKLKLVVDGITFTVDKHGWR